MKNKRLIQVISTMAFVCAFSSSANAATEIPKKPDIEVPSPMEVICSVIPEICMIQSN